MTGFCNRVPKNSGSVAVDRSKNTARSPSSVSHKNRYSSSTLSIRINLMPSIDIIFMKVPENLASNHIIPNAVDQLPSRIHIYQPWLVQSLLTAVTICSRHEMASCTSRPVEANDPTTMNRSKVLAQYQLYLSPVEEMHSIPNLLLPCITICTEYISRNT